MVIKRDRYLKQIVAKEKDGMIKIVTGIRRCGKSYLLNVLFRQHLLEEGVEERDIIMLAPVNEARFTSSLDCAVESELASSSILLCSVIGVSSLASVFFEWYGKFPAVLRKVLYVLTDDVVYKLESSTSCADLAEVYAVSRAVNDALRTSPAWVDTRSFKRLLLSAVLSK